MCSTLTGASFVSLMMFSAAVKRLGDEASGFAPKRSKPADASYLVGIDAILLDKANAASLLGPKEFVSALVEAASEQADAMLVVALGKHL
jgi:hypothetical protein